MTGFLPILPILALNSVLASLWQGPVYATVQNKDSAHAQATREQNAAEPSADTTDAPSAPLTWAHQTPPDLFAAMNSAAGELRPITQTARGRGIDPLRDLFSETPLP